MEALRWHCFVSGIIWCLLLTRAAGHSHINCTGFIYAQYDSPTSDDTCCDDYCKGGTCKGPNNTQCVGKCNTWIETKGPVLVLQGAGTMVQDGDVGTGSTIMAAYAAVDDQWDDNDYVALNVSLPANTALQKSITTSSSGAKVYQVVGEDSITVYGKVLNSLTYDNTADTPDNRTRRVCFVVSDGEHKSNIKCIDIAVVLINNHPPKVTATAKGEPYVEEGPKVLVLDSLILSDKDHPDMPKFFMQGARVSVIGGAPTDRLYVDVSSAGGDIWIEGGNGQTTVTLRGIAPLYKYQQVLLTTKYYSTDPEPYLFPRYIEFLIDDGNFTGTDTVTVEVIGINDNAPEITPGPSQDAFSEATKEPVRVAPDLKLDDPDKDPIDYIFSATIFICQGGLCIGNHFDSPDVDYEDLNIATTTTLQVTVSPDKTNITIEGKGSKEEYQRVLQYLTYFNSREPISCPIRRYIFVQVNDGINTGTAFVIVNIQFLNVDPPQLTATSTEAWFTEEGPPVEFAPDITPSDNDTRCNTSLLQSAKFKIYTPHDGIMFEILAVDQDLANDLGIVPTLSLQGTYVVLDLAGVADLRDYHTLLKTVTYQNVKDEPTPSKRFIKATVFDGKFYSNEIVFTITIHTINDKEPELKLDGTHFKFIENGGPTYFGPAMLTDQDNKPCDQNIISMSIFIQNALDGADETIKINLTLLSTFGLTLTPLTNGFRIDALDEVNGAPIEYFEAIVNSAKYCNDADDPEPMAEPISGKRFIVFEFETNAATPTTTFQFPLYVEVVNDNAPVVDLNGDEDGNDYYANFTEEGPGVRLSNGLQITDKDIESNTTIHKATIQIVDGLRKEDAIYVNVAGSDLTLMAPSPMGPVTYTIMGNADKSTYEAVLATAMYKNTADEPSRCYISIEFQVHDEDGRYSPIATVHITIIKLCDPLILKLDYNSSTYMTTFSEQDKVPVKVVNDMHFNISDDDSNMIVRGSISVDGFQMGWQDRLTVIGHPSPYQGVSVTYVNGQLIFDGTASFHVYSTLIKYVFYDNLDPCPPFLYVKLIFHFVDDCGAYNLPATTMITILPANDPPFIDLDNRTNQDPVEVTYLFQGISNLHPKPLTLFPYAVLTDCDTVNSTESLHIVLEEAGDLETQDEMLIFHLSGTHLVVTNTTDKDNFQVTYWVMPKGDYTASPQQFEMVLRKVQYLNTASRPFESARVLKAYASDGTSSGSPVEARINLQRIRIGPTVILGQMMVTYIVQEPPIKFEFLNFTGFDVLAGDIPFLKGVLLTITNPPIEGGQIKDYLMAPDISLLPSNWEIIDDNTAQLRMESIFPISFATAEDVKLLLLGVTFVCTAVGIHPPRNVSIEVYDIEGSGEIKTVTIKVQGLNNPPMFKFLPFHGSVTENSASGVTVVQVTAADPDGDTITYTNVGGDNMGHFMINSSTGLITTTDVPLDRETQESYTLTVMASDGMLTDTANVSITITDENDTCPVFDNTSYSTAILSSTGLDTVVVSLVISDDDLTAIFLVTITSGNTGGLFGIMGNDIVVAADLSGIGFTTFTLTVTLTDPAQPSCSDTATVTIVILTENSTFHFNVTEKQPPGTVVGQLIDDPSFPDATYIITDPLLAPFAIDIRSTITTTEVLIGGLHFKLTVTIIIRIGPYKFTVTVKVCIYVIFIVVVDLNGDGQDGNNTCVTLSESDPPEVLLVEAAATGVAQSGTSINYVTINLINSVDGADETLDASPGHPITKHYDAATHILTLSGSASAGDYSVALKTVKYQHNLMTDIRTMTKHSIELDRIIKVTAKDTDNIQSNTAIATVKLEATVKCTGDEVVETNSMLDQYAVATKIDCNFVIKCPSTVGCDITSLAVLTCLKEINGRLEITNTQVEDLRGLENVRSFQGLVLKRNSALTTTEHLQLATRRRRKRAGHLIELSGSITIQDCGVLDDVLGLKEISRVQGNIHIDDNQLKNGLYGLEDLAHVDGNFILEMNNGLRNLTGLDGLIAIGGDFELTNHNELKSVAGLENLERINGTLLISSNPELKNVDPLTQSLVRVGGDAIFLFNFNIICVDVIFWNDVVDGLFASFPVLPQCP